MTKFRKIFWQHLRLLSYVQPCGGPLAANDRG